MALPKKRCESTYDLFASRGTACGRSPADLVLAERKRLERTPTSEISNIKLALGSHAWLNSQEEDARLTAASNLLRERGLPRMMSSTPRSSRIQRIPGTDLVRFPRRPGRPGKGGR